MQVSFLEQQPEILQILKIRAASMQKGDTYQTNGRPGDCFIFVISGQSVYKTDRTFTLSPGRLLFIKNGTPYSMRAETDYYSYIFVEFRFAPSPIPFKCELFSDSDTDFTPLFRKMLEADVQNKPDSKIECLSLLYQIYAILAKQYTATEPKSSFKHAQIERADYELQRRYRDSDLLLSTIARTVGMSETYFRRLFREIHGISPMQYLLNLRIDHAKTLLTYRKAKISEVAVASGFSDIYYFSRQFKKQTGLTPTEYKRYVNSY